MCGSRIISVSLLQLTCSGRGQGGMEVVLLGHSARHNCITDTLQKQGKCCWPPALAVSAPMLLLQRRLPLCQYHCSICSGPRQDGNQAADPLYSSQQASC